MFTMERETVLRTSWYLLNDIASCLRIYHSEYFESQLPPSNGPHKVIPRSVRRRLRNPYLPFGYFRILSDVVLTLLQALPLKAVCVLLILRLYIW